MRMRNILVICIFSMALESCACQRNKIEYTNHETAQEIVEKAVVNEGSSDFNSDKAIETLKEFYTNYITLWDNSPNPLKNAKELKNIYVTSDFIEKLEEQELDYDPFVNAQDYDLTWLGSLEIKEKDSVKNVFVVSYVDSYSDRRKYIELLMVNNGDRYQIDDIF